ncbi:MAG: alpha/beta fold hydrolase [Reyranellaceae bacterium]
MAKISANGIELEYETHGAHDAPAILLVHGLGAQLTLWPEELVERLVAQGFRVVRFDNRDIGLSQKFEHYGVPDLPSLVMKVMGGGKIDAPYLLSDMAADAMALAGALGIDRPHVVGVSMGGMIVQQMAGDFPGKVASMTSIMSSSGRRGLPVGKPEAMKALLTPPASEDRDVVIAHGINLRQVIGSPAYPTPEPELRALVERNVDRSFYPQGSARQYNAILASGNRVRLLQQVKAPTLVIHGADDPVVPVEAGKDTASLVPGARLEVMPGMGHDLPRALLPRLAELIAGHARTAN